MSEFSRFECVLDPSEQWMVWDSGGDVPAEVFGFPLLGLRKDVAAYICDLFNEADRSDAIIQPAERHFLGART